MPIHRWLCVASAITAITLWANDALAKPFWNYFQPQTDPLCGDYGYGYRIQIASPPGMPSIPPSVYLVNKTCRHILFGPPSYQAQVDSERSRLIADLVMELYQRQAITISPQALWSLPYPECRNAASSPVQQFTCTERFYRLNRSERLQIPVFREIEILNDYIGGLDTGSSEWQSTIELTLATLRAATGKITAAQAVSMLGLPRPDWQPSPPKEVDPFVNWGKGENFTYKLLSPKNSPLSVEADVKATFLDGGGTQVVLSKGSIVSRGGPPIPVLGLHIGWCQMESGNVALKVSTVLLSGNMLREEAKPNVSLRLDGLAGSFVDLSLAVKPTNAWLCLGVVHKIEANNRALFWLAHSTDAQSKGCTNCF